MDKHEKIQIFKCREKRLLNYQAEIEAIILAHQKEIQKLMRRRNRVVGLRKYYDESLTEARIDILEDDLAKIGN